MTEKTFAFFGNYVHFLVFLWTDLSLYTAAPSLEYYVQLFQQAPLTCLSDAFTSDYLFIKMLP